MLIVWIKKSKNEIHNFCCFWLKYGFCKKALRKDATLKSWTLFWPQTCTFMYHRYLFVVKKVFNFSELHLSEVTSCEIYILVRQSLRFSRGCLFYYCTDYLIFLKIEIPAKESKIPFLFFIVKIINICYLFFKGPCLHRINVTYLRIFISKL